MRCDWESEMNPTIALLIAAHVAHWHGAAPRHFPHAHRHFFGSQTLYPEFGYEYSSPEWRPADDDRPVVIEVRPPLYQHCDPMGPIDADANQDCR
jgi:hypothetical protein